MKSNDDAKKPASYDIIDGIVYLYDSQSRPVAACSIELFNQLRELPDDFFEKDVD